MTKILFGRVVVRGGVGSALPPEGCTSAARRLLAGGYTPAGWRLHVCCLLSGNTPGGGCPAALKGA